MQMKNGESPAGPEKSGEKWLVETAVEGTLVHAGVQIDEDSLPGLKMNEFDLSADEESPAYSVLLCILGEVNGIEVTFLIDSGASECGKSCRGLFFSSITNVGLSFVLV